MLLLFPIAFFKIINFSVLVTACIYCACFRKSKNKEETKKEIALNEVERENLLLYKIQGGSEVDQVYEGLI